MTAVAEWVVSVIAVVILLGVGFVFGSVTRWRRSKVAGQSVIVPWIPDTKRNFTLVIGALSILTLLSVVQDGVRTRSVERCFDQYRSAFTTAVQISAIDESSDRENFAAVDTVIAALSSPGPELDAAIAEYSRVREESIARDKEIVAARDAAPMPTKDCR